MTSAPERTALYRLYDGTDQLLYVGITLDPEARWERHAYWMWWWPRVARKDIRWLDTSWRDALDLERDTIRAERPAHNGTHNHEMAPFDPLTWPDIDAPTRQKSAALAELIRSEITSGRWQPGDRIPNTSDLAAASAVSKGTVERAFRELVADGSLLRLHGLGTFIRTSLTKVAPNRVLAPR
ncbi:GntR family transcriptional regulator [Streptomyces sp. KL116D]|uniref:GntR family transcriptional regulator n=1 Tax=Streptomyces sp. KL116D TaxID=3045152 RepID=UPI0035561F9A